MAAKLRNVFSSTVVRGGHDPDTGELHIHWLNGKHSIYAGVPADLAERVLSAHSVGQALNEHIKPRYEHRYR